MPLPRDSVEAAFSLEYSSLRLIFSVCERAEFVMSRSFILRGRPFQIKDFFEIRAINKQISTIFTVEQNESF